MRLSPGRVLAGGVTIGLCLLALPGVADSRPVFTRSTETEVVPSHMLFNLPTPFLGWAATDDLGFVGADGLYTELGAPIARRPCGDTLRDAASPSAGALFAVLSADGRLCVYDGPSGPAVLDTKARATAVAMANVETVDAGGATSSGPVVVFTRSSNVLALDARSGHRRWSRDPDLGALTSAAASADGGFFVVGGERGAAVLYGQTGRLVRAVTTARRGVEDPVYSVAVDSDGKRLLTGQGDGRVTMWSLETGRSIRTLDMGEGAVVDVSWAKDGTQVTTVSRIPGAGGERLEFEVWDLVDDLPGFRESVPAPVASGGGLPPRPRPRTAPWGVPLTGSDGAGVSRVWQRPGRFNMPRGEALREIPHHRPAREPTTAVRLATSSDAVGDTLSAKASWPAPAGLVRLATDPSGGSAWVDAATHKELTVYGADGKVRARHALSRPARSASLSGERLVVVADDGTVRGSVKAGAPLAVVKDVAGATVAVTGTTAGVVWGSQSGDVTFTGGGQASRVYTVHAGPVTALACSPDGQRAVSVGPRVPDPGSADTVPTLGVGLLLRDPSSRGQVSSSILGGTEGFTWVVDGTTATVVMRGEEAIVRTDLETVVLDLQRGGRRLTLPFAARDAAFAEGETVRWIDPTGHARSVPIAAAAEAERPRGRTLCESRDGEHLATVDADVLTLWNGFEGRQGRSFAPTGTAILGCAFNDDGTQVAFLQRDGRFETWSVDAAVALAGVSGQAVDHPWFGFGPILDEDTPPPVTAESGTKKDRAEAFVEHGQLVSSVVGPGAVWVRKDATHILQLELGQGTLVETVELPAGVADIESRDGRFATLRDASGAALGFVDLAPGKSANVGRRVWDAATRPIAGHLDTYAWVKGGSLYIGPAAGPAEASPLPGSNPVAAVMNRDGRLLVIADDSNRVAVVSLPFRDAKLLAAGVAPGAPGASPFQERLWFAGEQILGRDRAGQVRGWLWMSPDGGRLAVRPPGAIRPVRDVRALVASPDGRTLYSGQGDNLVRGWDIEKAVQRIAYVGPVAPVHALAPSADGRYVTAGSADGTVRVFDVVTKVDTRSFLTFGEGNEAVAFGQEGAGGKVASLSDKGVLRVWDFATAKPLVHWTVSPFTGIAGLQWLPGLARLTATLDGLDWRVGLDEDGAAGGEPTALAAAPAFLDDPVAWTRLKAGRLASADALGHILLWDEAARLPYAQLTMLDDGGWISDRVDGVQVASRTLRDGTSPLLFGHGGATDAQTRAKVEATMGAAVTEQLPAVQECLAMAPSAAPGSNVQLGWALIAGVTLRLEVQSNTTGSDALAGCIVGVVQSLRFDLELAARDLSARWTVQGDEAVRSIGLTDDDAKTAPAVEAVLGAALAKVPGGCSERGSRTKGDAKLAWHVEAGHVEDVALLDGSTVTPGVAACLTKVGVGARVEGVERANGLWIVTGR